MSLNSFSQTEPEKMLTNFFKAIREQDSSGFIEYYITYAELGKMIKGFFYDSLNADNLENNSTENSEVYAHYVIQKEFKKLLHECDSLKINLKNSKYFDCKFEIIKDPQILFASLNGSVFFTSNNKNCELKITEAVYINNNWKIIKLGDINLWSDTSVFSKKYKSLTAFNSMLLTVEDVQLADIKDSPDPPPSPPPLKNQ